MYFLAKDISDRENATIMFANGKVSSAIQLKDDPSLTNIIADAKRVYISRYISKHRSKHGWIKRLRCWSKRFQAKTSRKVTISWPAVPSMVKYDPIEDDPSLPSVAIGIIEVARGYYPILSNTIRYYPMLAAVATTRWGFDSVVRGVGGTYGPSPLRPAFCVVWLPRSTQSAPT